MNHFLLFIAALVALFVLLVNIGPMIVLAISLLLLYVVFVQFTKSRSTVGKALWFVIGFIVLSMAVANSYSLFGVVAAIVLYLIYKKWSEGRTTSKNNSAVHI
ncbi:flagellar basal body rod protein [Bacillus shivajii]|uniref:lmo0954 family membrane protein n=1 Tax=Bacillus shivajii TaxID=1983719 RepID=UPI001CFA08E6|nr:flagellar basal body rod protein [Bacillus shivajii]UCZ52116.1 flagellar basal body rod protein [Bacillus shivajii]